MAGASLTLLTPETFDGDINPFGADDAITLSGFAGAFIAPVCGTGAAGAATDVTLGDAQGQFATLHLINAYADEFRPSADAYSVICDPAQRPDAQFRLAQRG